jgi:hypothetical protein
MQSPLSYTHRVRYGLTIATNASPAILRKKGKTLPFLSCGVVYALSMRVTEDNGLSSRLYAHKTIAHYSLVCGRQYVLAVGSRSADSCRCTRRTSLYRSNNIYVLMYGVQGTPTDPCRPTR